MAMFSRNPVRSVLIDLSGTLHVEDVGIPGAKRALGRWEPSRFSFCRVLTDASLPGCGTPGYRFGLSLIRLKSLEDGYMSG